jgi:NAD-dependent dihydropyrimidine dehydrogenase PreA subunit
MPQPKVILDYQACDPSYCENGVCAAALVCEKKVLKQEKPGELPELNPSLCRGCVDCIPACPREALRLMR